MLEKFGYRLIYIFKCINHVHYVGGSLTLILPVQRGVYNAHFTLFHGKSPHFAVYFIQNNTNATNLNFGTFMPKSIHYNLTFSKIWKMFCNQSYLINGPIMPPAGRIGLKKYAGQIRIKVWTSIIRSSKGRRKKSPPPQT